MSLENQDNYLITLVFYIVLSTLLWLGYVCREYRESTGLRDIWAMFVYLLTWPKKRSSRVYMVFTSSGKPYQFIHYCS